MALISNKGYIGMELLDLLFEQTDGIICPEAHGGHGNQAWPITDHVVSDMAIETLCHAGGGADNLLDSLLSVAHSSTSGGSPLWAPSPCDSGISEDPASDPQDSPPLHTSPLFPQHHHHHNHHQQQARTAMDTVEADVSIDLAGWESSLFSERATEPQLSSAYTLTVKDLLLSNIGEPPKPPSQQSLQELILNDDEKKLLAKEGVNLPSQLPLTKYEEKILKKIRRKIRNKQSAQESRKKKKEYIDGLEGRMAACSAQNLELQRKVFQLERNNTSLIEQLRSLQALVMSGSSKPAQTGTCILVLLLSFSLILLPSLQPVSHSRASQPGDFSPARVQSRSLRSVVEVRPVLSEEVTATALLAKLHLRPPGYADMDPLPHNCSYGGHYQDQHHLHGDGDPITGRVAVLSWEK